jgi:two-component system cell cycle sensor histidine kinase PleC
MVAAEAVNLHFGGHDLAGAVQNLAPEADQVGRAFILVNEESRVLRSSIRHVAPGQMLGGLFLGGEPLHLIELRGHVFHLMLQDGREASVIARDVVPGLFLLAYQPIDDELITWRRHAYVILALLAAFGAVTTAFSAAFYMQRARARNTQQGAERLFNRFEVALDRGNLGLLDCRIGGSQVWLSNSMFRLLGLPERERMLARAAIEALVHPEDHSPLSLVEGVDLAAGEVDHVFRMRHEALGWRWFHMRAALVVEGPRCRGRLLGIVMDVTEEREAVAIHARAEARLHDAIESISEAFVLWDENNRLVLCNSKYRSFHGIVETHDVRGTRYDDLMSKTHEPRLLIEIERQPDCTAHSRAYEAQFDDGRWLLISERPTSAGGYVSVGTDITSRKLQEARLIENERQLRITIADLATSREALRKQAQELHDLANLYREQKAEAIGALRVKAEFLANMNHEMRTPLNAIIGFAEAIEHQSMGPHCMDRYQDYARDIRLSGNKLLVLIEDVLEMASIEAGRVQVTRESLSVAEVLAKAAEQVEADAKTKDIRLDVEPQPLEPTARRMIHIDSRATAQALNHLLRNAIRLSPYGGAVTLRARMQGDHLNIFISDRGCHLSESDLGTLTKPFGHIDGMLEDGCKGSGLGFAIARGLIELQGGTLRLRSTPQIGALTMIHLPIAPQPVQLNLPMLTLADAA